MPRGIQDNVKQSDISSNYPEEAHNEEQQGLCCQMADSVGCKLPSENIQSPQAHTYVCVAADKYMQDD